MSEDKRTHRRSSILKRSGSTESPAKVITKLKQRRISFSEKTIVKEFALDADNYNTIWLSSYEKPAEQQSSKCLSDQRIPELNSTTTENMNMETTTIIDCNHSFNSFNNNNKENLLPNQQNGNNTTQFNEIDENDMNLSINKSTQEEINSFVLSNGIFSRQPDETSPKTTVIKSMEMEVSKVLSTQTEINSFIYENDCLSSPDKTNITANCMEMEFTKIKPTENHNNLSYSRENSGSDIEIDSSHSNNRINTKNQIIDVSDLSGFNSLIDNLELSDDTPDFFEKSNKFLIRNNNLTNDTILNPVKIETTITTPSNTSNNIKNLSNLSNISDTSFISNISIDNNSNASLLLTGCNVETNKTTYIDVDCTITKSIPRHYLKQINDELKIEKNDVEKINSTNKIENKMEKSFYSVLEPPENFIHKDDNEEYVSMSEIRRLSGIFIKSTKIEQEKPVESHIEKNDGSIYEAHRFSNSLAEMNLLINLTSTNHENTIHFKDENDILTENYQDKIDESFKTCKNSIATTFENQIVTENNHKTIETLNMCENPLATTSEHQIITKNPLSTISENQIVTKNNHKTIETLNVCQYPLATTLENRIVTENPLATTISENKIVTKNNDKTIESLNKFTNLLATTSKNQDVTKNVYNTVELCENALTTATLLPASAAPASVTPTSDTPTSDTSASDTSASATPASATPASATPPPASATPLPASASPPPASVNNEQNDENTDDDYNLDESFLQQYPIDEIDNYELDFNGLERLAGTASIHNVMLAHEIRRQRLKIEEEEYNGISENFYAPDILFLIKNKIEEISSTAVSSPTIQLKSIFPLGISFEFLWDNKFRTETETSKWVYDGRFFYSGYVIFRHKKVRSIPIHITYVSENIVEHAIQNGKLIFHKVTMKPCPITTKKMLPRDWLCHREILSKLHCDLLSLCSTSNEIHLFLEKIDKIYCSAYYKAIELYRITYENEGILSQENGEIFAERDIINFKKMSIQRITIKLVHIDNIGPKNVYTSPLLQFDSVKLNQLPLGLEFFKEILIDPFKYVKNIEN